nr:GPCR kinase [Tanacetum cinerariifolium]
MVERCLRNVSRKVAMGMVVYSEAVERQRVDRIDHVRVPFVCICEAWVSATNYVIAFGGTVTGCLGDIDSFLKKGKHDQVVAIVKSCYPNDLGDLNVTLKDVSGTVPGTIHYKVLDVGSYGKDITVGAAMILANVSVFTPKPSEHYLNITTRNVVEVFRKDTVSLV